MRKAIYYLITAMAFLAIACGRRSGGDDGPSTITSLKMNGEDISGANTSIPYYSAPFVIDLEFTTKYRGGKYFLKLEEGGDYKVTAGNTTYTQDDFIPIPEYEDLLKKLSFSVEVEGTRKIFKPNIYFLDNELEGPTLLPKAFNQGFRMEVLSTTEGQASDFAITLFGDTDTGNNLGGSVGRLSAASNNVRNVISVVAQGKEQYSYEYSITVKVKDGAQGNLNAWAYTPSSGVLNGENNYRAVFNVKFTSDAYGAVYGAVGDYEVSILFRRSDNRQILITKTIRFFDDRINFDMYRISTNQMIDTLNVKQYQEISNVSFDYPASEQLDIRNFNKDFAATDAKMSFKYDDSYIRLFYNETNPATGRTAGKLNSGEPVLPDAEIKPPINHKGDINGNIYNPYNYLTVVGIKPTPNNDFIPVEVILEVSNGARVSRTFRVRVTPRSLNEVLHVETLRSLPNNTRFDINSIPANDKTPSIFPTEVSGVYQLHSRENFLFRVLAGEPPVPNMAGLFVPVGENTSPLISPRVDWRLGVTFSKKKVTDVLERSFELYRIDDLVTAVSEVTNNNTPILSPSIVNNASNPTPLSSNTPYRFIVLNKAEDTGTFEMDYKVTSSLTGQEAAVDYSFSVVPFVQAIWKTNGPLNVTAWQRTTRQPQSTGYFGLLDVPNVPPDPTNPTFSWGDLNNPAFFYEANGKGYFAFCPPGTTADANDVKYRPVDTSYGPLTSCQAEYYTYRRTLSSDSAHIENTGYHSYYGFTSRKQNFNLVETTKSIPVLPSDFSEPFVVNSYFVDYWDY